MLSTKIKIVFIVFCEYSQQWEEYFCIRELLEDFDIEYWDCSDFVHIGVHLPEETRRPFVKKIANLKEFKRGLQCLPKDTLINLDVHFNKENYKFHKLLSSSFKHIIFVDFYANAQSHDAITNSSYASNNDEKISTFKRFKRWIFQNDICQLIGKSVAHPQKFNDYLFDFFEKTEEKMYVKHLISCRPGSSMYINHPDVNKVFFQSKNKKPLVNDKYIVYVDQNFPYHAELKEWVKDLDVELIADKHFKSLNNFFDVIERKYGCKVIIAAHPSSDYSNNPFGGRTILYHATENLVANSFAVCMHSSNAISYVILYDKPILVLLNEAIKAVQCSYYPTVNLINKCCLESVDIDNISNVFEFVKVPTTKRLEYLLEYFGSSELNPRKSNTQLFKEYYVNLHTEIYG